MTTIAQLRTRIEAAKSRYETQRAKLLRPDGSKFYSDAEHDERLAALRSERNAALREVEREAEAIATEARSGLTALENGSPVALLTTEELERANARRALVLDDVATLDQGELINRLGAVLHGADRVSMFCYLQAGRRRARELRQRPADESAGVLESPAASGAGAVPPELSRTLDELAEKLTPDSRKAELESTSKRVEEAAEVQGIAYLAIRDQSSVYAPNYAVTGR